MIDSVYEWVAEHIDYSLYYDYPSAPDVRLQLYKPIEYHGNSYTEMVVHVHYDTVAIELHVGDQWREIEELSIPIVEDLLCKLKQQRFKFVVL